VSEGRLVVCATPIGNLGDASERLAAALRGVDVVYAEDTRRTAKLLAHVGASPRSRSMFAGNEKERTERLLVDLRSGLAVALVSDAGTPTISDPGAEAIRRAREEGFAVTAVPGPSAVTTAVATAGLGGDRFSFEGFLPRKGKERASRLERIAGDDKATVIFSSPARVGRDLADLAAALDPGVEVVVARELTKVHEEVWAGALDEAARRWAGEQRGEFTLVLAPPSAAAAGSGEERLDEAVETARALIERGSSPSQAARAAAAETGAPRRAIYQLLLED